MLSQDELIVLSTPKFLEFDWQGTQLGIRVEGESTFTYVELKGATGATGAQGPQGIPGPSDWDALPQHCQPSKAFAKFGSNLFWGYSIALTTGLIELPWYNGESIPPYWVGLISHRIATTFNGNEGGLSFVEKTDSTVWIYPIKSPVQSSYNILLVSEGGKLKARFSELQGPFPAIFSFSGISYFG
ncbi:hypothetical protein VB834_09220 [Limnoraphis robusta Tam1]|uniref:Uncharacterized protein n=1 Tax=Limnoraphis robusta CCNP1315 TaxID=3110306 RepID=A0ABU5TX87_9CYAN|nr:hypothetical protein [Limnoraphis robusta]MEA5500369.1 hypothetical protein [Limnoraphis robusta BA-68 BA1]MEA5519549.1 hypothetical protein [Limnoraphis robusta CCNP1315]MEA5539213.1 hypothetical protein [Limnoraphis robusta Tam1]MEA5545817.1 hypothetical protein [Limnoraphis robusta CCNP1324]